MLPQNETKNSQLAITMLSKGYCKKDRDCNIVRELLSFWWVMTHPPSSDQGNPDLRFFSEGWASLPLPHIVYPPQLHGGSLLVSDITFLFFASSSARGGWLCLIRWYPLLQAIQCLLPRCKSWPITSTLGMITPHIQRETRAVAKRRGLSNPCRGLEPAACHKCGWYVWGINAHHIVDC